MGDSAWALRIQRKPFVDWIWGGCVVMALGGLIAATDRRYRVTVKARHKAETGVAGKGQAIGGVPEVNKAKA